jgi:hypothetical protein
MTAEKRLNEMLLIEAELLSSGANRHRMAQVRQRYVFKVHAAKTLAEEQAAEDELVAEVRKARQSKT